MTYNPPTPATCRLIHPPNDESKMKKRKVFPWNFHFAILSQTVVVFNVAAGGGERRSAGVRQLPATPTALSSNCKWQEGGAGAMGGAKGGVGGAGLHGTEVVNQGLLTPQPPLGVALLVCLAGESGGRWVRLHGLRL